MHRKLNFDVLSNNSDTSMLTKFLTVSGYQFYQSEFKYEIYINNTVHAPTDTFFFQLAFSVNDSDLVIFSLPRLSTQKIFL